MWKIWAVSTAVVLTACGGGGGSSSSDAVNNGGGGSGGTTPQPSLSLTASATSVTEGNPVTLTWSSTNVDSCTASGGWSGDRAVSGSETTSALNQSTTFSLSCSGANGGVMADVAVGVTAPGQVSLSFNVDRDIVRSGESVRLTWSATNANSCTASGAWSGSQATSGNFDTAGLSADSTFTLRCENSTASDVQQIAVRLANTSVSWQPPTTNTDGSALTDLDGFRLYWGDQSGSYDDSVDVAGSVTQYDLSSLQTGAYYVAVTALDATGDESAFSNEVERVVP